MDSTQVDGIMLARGALIKPWIFTEIKEHRGREISSREHLERSHVLSFTIDITVITR